MKKLLLILLFAILFVSCESESQKKRNEIIQLKEKLISANQKVLDSAEYYQDILQSEFPFITKNSKEKYYGFVKRSETYMARSIKTNDSLTKVYNSIK